MTVIPIPRRWAPGPGRQADPPVVREAAITGSFRSPTGRAGTMTGSLRVERVIKATGRVWAECVFSGTLVDADGSYIGTGSRRQTVPAVIEEHCHGSLATIGPVEVDLLGLAITIPALTVVNAAGVGRPHAPTRERQQRPSPLPRRDHEQP